MFKDTKRMSATDTLIGHGTLAEGKMISDANLRIEGEYRGDIECRGIVVIGECGVARSNIVAQDVTLAGKLYGDVKTSGRVIITSSGQLTGNLSTQSLIIQDGGVINGSCHMEQKQEKEKGRNRSDSGNDSGSSKKDAKNEQAGDGRLKSRQAG